MRRRRGSIYILVLAVSALVTVVGISSLTVARIEARSAFVDGDAGQARHLAAAAIELGLWHLENQADWKAVVPHDTWIQLPDLGNGALEMRLEDLGPNPGSFEDRMRVYGRAATGDAVRIVSVECTTGADGAPPNLLSNGNLEDGLRNWSATNCTMTYELDQVHAGAGALRMADRVGGAAATYDVTGLVESGVAYDVGTFIYNTGGASYLTFILRVETDTGVRVDTRGGGWFAEGVWLPMTSSVGLTFSGTMVSATLAVAWAVGTADVIVDDLRMSEQGAPLEGAEPIRMMPGTWRDEVDF